MFINKLITSFRAKILFTSFFLNSLTYQMLYQQNMCVEQKEHIAIYQQLSDIYSDIQGELCSKQSTLLNKLKNSFTQIYDGVVPSHFIMVNHISSLSNEIFNIFQGKDITFSMENGLILLVKKTYEQENLFINSSFFEKQMEFNCQGKIMKLDNFKKQNKNDKNSLQKQIQEVIDLVTQQLSINKLFGGVIYIYSNIKQNVTYFKEKLLLGIYLATLIINGQLNQLSIEQIYLKLSSKKEIFSKTFLQKQLLSEYQKRQFFIQNLQKSQMCEQNQELVDSIPVQKKKKLVFMDAGLRKQDIIIIKDNKKKLKQQKNSLQKNKQLSSITINQQFKKTSIKINQLFRNIQTKVNNNSLKIENIFQSIKQITCSHGSPLNIYPKQLLQVLSQNLMDISNLSYLLIQQGEYIVFCVDSHLSHQLIRKLRQILVPPHQQNPQIISKKFGNNQNLKIDQRIFSCVPSVGLAILNPENEMWFK